MRSERLIIGLGTGRCGTVSLAVLLNLQNGARVMHEAAGWPFEYQNMWMPWDIGKDTKSPCPDREQFCRYLNAFPLAEKFTGDVGYYYLAYVETIAAIWRDVKFVCLQRDRDDTIASLMAKAIETNRNPWQNHGGTQWMKAATYPCWPKFDNEPTREDACAAYYDFYYSEAERYSRIFGDRFAIFQTSDLNTKEGVIGILDFCGITDHVVAVGIHKNQGPKMTGDSHAVAKLQNV